MATESEDGQDTQPLSLDQDNNDAPAVATPTPATRKRGRKKGSTNAKKTTDGNESADSGDDSVATPAKKGKTGGAATPTPKKLALGPIPTSLANASDTDKMIIRMRDEDGKGWGEITTAWVSKTGVQVGGTTLRCRYTTMKANFFTMPEDDENKLLKAKTAVEEKMESEKWHRIADAMVEDGAQKYPAATLQKKFKELTKRVNGAAASVGMGNGTTEE